MKRLVFCLVVCLMARGGRAAGVPGFRAELLGSTAGFASSIVADSRGILYYTTTRGGIFRFDNGQSVRVAQVATEAIANAGLLGMALVDDRTAVVHYTTPGVTHEVISRIDLGSGSETILAKLACDFSLPGRSVPPEHHGGNPIVAPDGSIFVGIGDFGGYVIAQKPEWIAGKILRLRPDGRIEQFASGFRNPFDLAWDEEHQLLVVPDNGEGADDEINLVTPGGNYGWPYSFGSAPPFNGDVQPVYVFPAIVAPTGIATIRAGNAYLRRGLLLGSFVTKAIYYIPDLAGRPLPDPIPLIERATAFVIDVTETPAGEVVFTTGIGIYRLRFPRAGDCNGDDRLDLADLDALDREIADAPRRTIDAQDGAHRGSWGCDANLDGAIDARDRVALYSILRLRTRSVR